MFGCPVDKRIDRKTLIPFIFCKQAIEENQARIDVEQKHDDQILRWRRQLEVKAKEFDELQIQMALPGDLKILEWI